MLLSQSAFLGLIILLALWLGGLTFWLYRVVSHYKRLTDGAQRGDLASVLEKLLQSDSSLKERIKQVEDALTTLDQRSQKHIQKVGIVRFNPYSETGGNQSFALCLLDREDSGVVLLSLHGRETTRTYVKEVVSGKSRYELSKEEKQVVETARKQKIN